MEEKVFPAAAVAAILEPSYVEARLHNDGAHADEVRALQSELARSIATPYYVLQEPGEPRVVGRLDHPEDPEDFAAFLEGPLVELIGRR